MAPKAIFVQISKNQNHHSGHIISQYFLRSLAALRFPYRSFIINTFDSLYPPMLKPCCIHLLSFKTELGLYYKNIKLFCFRYFQVYLTTLLRIPFLRHNPHFFLCARSHFQLIELVSKYYLMWSTSIK
jgi:hypothetical protein